MKNFLDNFNEPPELEDLYQSLNAFRADFECILNGNQTFNGLQQSYDKDMKHIRRDMKIFCKMAFLMCHEIEKVLKNPEVDGKGNNYD